LSANLSKQGRPVIEMDMARVREMLASMPLVRVADELGVNRNTIYYRVQTDPLWRECVTLPRRRTTRIPYQPDPFRTFIACFIGKSCDGCNEAKPLAEFPRKGDGRYRNKCQACTQKRWNELQTEKRSRRDEARAEVLRALLPILAELAWRVRCFNRVRRRAVPCSRGNIGRPWVPIDLDAVHAITEHPRRSVRAIARELGVHYNTLLYRLKVDPRLADAVTRGIARPVPKVRERALRIRMPKVRVFSLDAPVFASDGLVGDRHGIIADPNATDPLERLLEREAVASVVERLVRERNIPPSAATEVVRQHVDIDAATEPELTATPPAPVSFSEGVERRATPEPIRLRIGWHNYREVARGFSREQLRRLAEILRRHDRANCEECAATSKKRGCPFAVEAVEVIALVEAEMPKELPDFYPATDWTRQLYRNAD
jgi:hypothetical protein